MNSPNLDLVEVAKKFIGTVESGGDNCGPQIVEFQKAVDSVASKEPWCMAFVQYCVKQVEQQYSQKSELYASELCRSVWNLTPVICRVSDPEPGAIVIWEKHGTTQGHTGIVSEVLPGGFFRTIEGNTSPGPGIERNGDGVYAKVRNRDPQGSLRILGFIRPFFAPNPTQ